MRGIIWTKAIFDEFVEKAMLSDEEIAVLETAIRGWSRVKQADKLNMSASKIYRILKKCELKYDAVQKQSDILPKRICHKNDRFCA